MITNSQEKDFFTEYSCRLQNVLANADWSGVKKLAEDMLLCWQAGQRVFICGNGGSAANAIHMANDFLYGISKSFGAGMKVLALSANPAVMTCLANDLGYEHVFSEQLAVQAVKDDLLIALSGSGNSANILCALEKAKDLGVKSYAILGYSGGRCLELADESIHFAVDDMQIAEDLQLIAGHMVMQWLYANRQPKH
ncbi:MAG: SIS domain-containing protein [Chlorobiaceae bacterium]